MTDKAPYTPKHLKRWTLPQYYVGAHWDAYYAAPVSRHRDSEAYDRSNWREQLAALGGESEDGESIVVVHERHFLVGWVEWVAIHQTAYDALRVADELHERLERYPILNENETQLQEDLLAEEEDDEDEDDEPLARDESIAKGLERTDQPDPPDEDSHD